MADANGAIMQTAAPVTRLDDQTMLLVVAGGDCSKLNPQQKLAYYHARCDAAGLDPRTQPFEFTKLNGKEVLYARKAAADGLASKHGIQLSITNQVTEADIRVVTVRATAKDGRQTEDVGAVNVKGLSGEALANALMKTVTKAKRRAVLSLTGLGMLDETEVETVPHSAPAPEPHTVETPRLPPKVEVLPPESKPEPAKAASKVPPAHVLSLWNKVLAAKGKNRAEAQADWNAAAASVFGPTEKPSSKWTLEETKRVEDVLFPTDINF
jgi:hypothetical protein